ncbi:BTAD domain-containing putative transcriptional regulator [Nonomuraea sp. NPDC049309]|uniref:BTAD domain-containing putative transcriptional regulator n=1 Tax=Nonomuraea sp. NPDC049309 TaxID=3364350 RepID=UPI00371C69B3
MRVGILGPLRVAGSEVGGARVRALLIRLALAPGRVVTADRLIDDLWPGDPPAHPSAALQSLVSRARREAPGLIASHPAGYLLDVAADEVDAWAFERLVRQGDVRRALALWRGAPLADAAGLPFAAGPAARLEELRLTALAARIAADLDLTTARPTGSSAAPPTGPGPEELVAELEELVAAYPLREPFHALLVRALTVVGRRAEALAAFERIRNALADELGVDPGPELREAHLAALQDQEPPRRGRQPPGSDLPARLTRFVGRSEDIARVGRLLGTARLVTLVGPGGAGKTRLAIEIASALIGPSAGSASAPTGPSGSSAARRTAPAPQGAIGRVEPALGVPALAETGRAEPGPVEAALRPERVWVVELAAAGDVRAAVEETLRTADPVATLRAAPGPALLVMDNCEHVIDDAAKVAQWLLSEVAGLRILATSREPLDIPGESLHHVRPLPPDQAVELFLDRAAAARPDATVSAQDAERICRELDGIPLAIELAAARLRTMPVEVLMRQLGDRLAFRGGRTSEPRHRTLRAVIDWSWNLLSEPERELLRGLTVFSGGATYEAIAAVCGGDPDLLSSLVDKSLIMLQGDRYTMLETIRQYAAADLPELRRAHARYYTELAATADAHLRTGEQLKWLAVLDAERGNLDAALRHTDDPLRLITLRFWPWIVRGRYRELTEQASAVLARAGDVPPPGRELEHGLCVAMTGGPVSDVVRESDHPMALAAWTVGGSNGPRGEVVELAEKGLARLRTHPDLWTRSAAMLLAGAVRFEYGSVTGAEELLEPALAGFRRTGDRWGQWATYYFLSLAAENRGDFAAAVALSEEPERLAAELEMLETPLGPMTFLIRLGLLKARAGDHEGAARALERAWAAAVRSDDDAVVARVLHARAELARRTGDRETARELLERARARDVQESAQFHALMAVEYARVCPDPAEPLRQALRLMEGCSDRTVRAAVLEGVAEHVPAGLAAELLGAARALRGITESADPHVNALAARCEQALGAAAYRAALDRGAAIPNPERYALSPLSSP